LENASVYFNKGEITTLKGSSGIGKSTLIKLMLGVYNIDGGEMVFDTEDGNINIDSTTRKMFSYVPQGNMIFSGTLKENVKFINENATEQQIERALKISCAYDFIKTLPNGLETIVGENGVGLSEGQIQRVAIARAVLCNAPVILLDEATSALDEQTESTLLKNLKELEGVTLIIISHKKAAADICNKRIRVEDKKIVLSN
jgi:ATP-binding cassette subfamily B protein